MSTLEQLISRRGSIKGQLTRFCTFIRAYEDSQYNELQPRLDKIEIVWGEFDHVQESIEFMDSTEADSDVRSEFEKKYFEAVGKCKNLLKAENSEGSISSSNGASRKSESDESRAGAVIEAATRASTSGVNTRAELELQKYVLPKFNGEYDRWFKFKNTFESLILKNPKIDESQRFYRLQECVTGNAEAVIEGIEEFTIAWDLLIERFEDRPSMIQKHLKELLNLPVIKVESGASIRKLLDEINRHIRSLKSLDESVDSWDTLLILLMSQKLDEKSRDSWEKTRVVKFRGVPKFSNFLDFLLERCKGLEARSDRTMESSNKPKFNNKFPNSFNKANYRSKAENVTSAHVSEGRSITCEYCQGKHFVYSCGRLLELSVERRKEEIKKLKLCLNCLRSSHFARDCRSMGCKKCRGRHNTILHSETQTSPVVGVIENANQAGSNLNNEVALHCGMRNQVLLSTALVLIADNRGKFHRARCLLDNGSQPSFITRELSSKLGITVERVNIPVVGINRSNNSIVAKIQAEIKSYYNNYKMNIPLLVVNEITNPLPSVSFDCTKLKIPENLTLADPEFSISSPIDILLGAAVFFDMLCVGQIKLGTGLPILQKSMLGWLISGPLQIYNAQEVVCNLSIEDDEIKNILEKFWDTEECSNDAKELIYSKEELECEVHFRETTKRGRDGKFIVSLPTRDTFNNLGESLAMAEKRLNGLQRRFMRNKEFKIRYANFMSEYEEMGHMSRIGEHELEGEGTKAVKIFYLPHHGVIKNDSSTTKLRVVFDASCKSNANLSLNDVLKVGPSIQDDLFSILCRFRSYPIVITADIEKMYRMIWVDENQRDLQRIIWMDDDSKYVSYRLNTITYGTGPASFLATRCLAQVSADISEENPEVSRIISRDFYMDDLITGGETVEKVAELAKTISDILKRYGFNLRKWSSNCSEALTNLVDKDSLAIGQTDFADNDHSSKTLGIYWNASSDELGYKIKIPVCSNEGRVTKRQIMSIVARIFDPLGLLGPVIIKAKMFLQTLWQLGIGWDEAVPLDIHTAWHQFESQLVCLNDIGVCRSLELREMLACEFHGFSDASERAYGACIYVKVVNREGASSVRLLCAKSRVAALKGTTIPRLELCGALLLAKLMKRVVNSLNIEGAVKYFWCDSTIALAWISSEPSSLKTFVSNRVGQIQGMTEISEWRHVESGSNPADIISRGVMPSSLRETNLWWQGPFFLTLQNYGEIGSHLNLNLQDIPERKRKERVCLAVNMDHSFINRYSSLRSLKSTTAWIYRFYNNTKGCKNSRNLSARITSSELEFSLQILIKAVQHQEYAKEIESIKSSNQILKSSKLLDLSPFLDENNLLRVGGRIKMADVDFSSKFPIILPPKHHLTRLVIHNEHLKQLHAGPSTLLAIIRQRYWVINGKREVRSVLSKCVVCFKNRPKPLKQKMGDLPLDRVTPNRPFYVCGTDFAGPFLTKESKLRNRKFIKSYMCIFICFSTKAVHIEAVSDLSSDAFLNVFKRFIARRGLCKRIYSDNGRNYVGANHYLKEVVNVLVTQNNSLSKFATENSIEWHFIPSYSPHQGGIWESAVRLAKYHSSRVIGNNHFTFEELLTLFAQIESILNSRPITELSSNPDDFYPLTPGHFLVGSPLNCLPESSLDAIPLNRLSRYQLLQQCMQSFWNRWQKEYLTSLQKRSKWTSSSSTIKIGSLVVLKEDDTPPLSWRLGRIVEVHPGNDGLVRVMSVKTSHGVVKRAVQRICPLPID